MKDKILSALSVGSNPDNQPDFATGDFVRTTPTVRLSLELGLRTRQQLVSLHFVQLLWGKALLQLGIIRFKTMLYQTSVCH